MPLRDSRQQKYKITPSHDHRGLVGLTFLFCELVKKTGFADAHVADDDVFEDVGVVVRPGRHFEGLLF
jgi:hypothetical protein